jgi:hypothetical protein
MPSQFATVFLHLFFAHMKMLETAVTDFIFKIYNFLEWSRSVNPVLSMLCLARLTRLDALSKNEEAVKSFFRLIIPSLMVFSDEEDALYSVAKLCMNYVSRKGDSFVFLSVFKSLAMPVIPLLSCLCAFDANFRLRLLQQARVWCEIILRHALDSDCSVRILALNAITAFCRDLGPMFQEDCLNELFEFFCGTAGDFLVTPQMAVAFYNAITAFFSKLRLQMPDGRSLVLFTLIFPAFHKSGSKMEIADCICAIIEANAKEIRPHFPEMLRYLIEWIPSEFVLSVLRISAKIGKFEDGNHDLLIPFWRASLQLRQRVKTGFEVEICDDVICTLTGVLKTELIGELGALMTDVFSGVAQQIVVSVFEKGSGIDHISGFQLVQSIHEDRIVFVSETSIIDICSFLKIIKICAREFQEQYFKEFGEATLTVCSQLLLLPYHISPIKESAWEITNTISDSVNISSIIFAHFLQSVAGIWTDDYLSFMEKIVVCAIEKHGLPTDDHELLPLFECFSRLVALKAEAELNEFTFDWEGRFFKCVLPSSIICAHFTKLFPIILPLLSHDCAGGFVFSILAEYFAISGDLSAFPLFAEAAFVCIRDSESPSAPEAMKALGRCFESVSCDPSFLHVSYQRICDILGKKESYENDSLPLFDQTVISFVKFLCSHSSMVNLAEAIPLFLNSLPLSTASDESHLVAAFFVELPIDAIIAIAGPVRAANLCNEQIGTRFVTPEVDKKLREVLAAIVSGPGFPVNSVPCNET